MPLENTGGTWRCFDCHSLVGRGVTGIICAEAREVANILQYIELPPTPSKELSSWSFPGGMVVKNLPANARDAGLIPGSGKSSGEGDGNPLQYSCLGNSIDRGAWWATHSSIAAWEIPWMQDSGRLWSMWSQKSDTTEHTDTHRCQQY